MARLCQASCVPPAVLCGCKRVPPGTAGAACQDASRERQTAGAWLIWEALAWHPGQCQAHGQGARARRVQAEPAHKPCGGSRPRGSQSVV